MVKGHLAQKDHVRSLEDCASDWTSVTGPFTFMFVEILVLEVGVHGG
jgi:hypothetical protein